ncbi:hypothetical protein ACP70R_036221 [Stipagrostis hirtigluma subsp. patula]
MTGSNHVEVEAATGRGSTASKGASRSPVISSSVAAACMLILLQQKLHSKGQENASKDQMTTGT